MMEKEEIRKQVETLKHMIKGISENETIKNSPMYQQLLDKYLDELNELLKKLKE
jgi:uncharacterized protein YlaN (UPF0358 family)